MNVWLVALIVVLVLVVLSAGAHSYRTYGPRGGYGGGETVVNTGAGSGSRLVTLFLVLVIIALLVALYLGFNVFNWFGDHVDVNVH